MLKKSFSSAFFFLLKSCDLIPTLFDGSINLFSRFGISSWADLKNKWGKANNAEEIIMLADGNGHFTKQIGLDMNTSNFGGLRSLRYSMLIEDGEVKKINVEDPGRFDVSDAQSMLDSL